MHSSAVSSQSLRRQCHRRGAFSERMFAEERVAGTEVSCTFLDIVCVFCGQGSLRHWPCTVVPGAHDGDTVRELVTRDNLNHSVPGATRRAEYPEQHARRNALPRTRLTTSIDQLYRAKVGRCAVLQNAWRPPCRIATPRSLPRIVSSRYIRRTSFSGGRRETWRSAARGRRRHRALVRVARRRGRVEPHPLGLTAASCRALNDTRISL